MNDLSDEQLYDSRQAEYKEVANNFRTLTNIRFKYVFWRRLGERGRRDPPAAEARREERPFSGEAVTQRTEKTRSDG
jgi:hypothetical protein